MREEIAELAAREKQARAQQSKLKALNARLQQDHEKLCEEVKETDEKGCSDLEAELSEQNALIASLEEQKQDLSAYLVTQRRLARVKGTVKDVDVIESNRRGDRKRKH